MVGENSPIFSQFGPLRTLLVRVGWMFALAFGGCFGGMTWLMPRVLLWPCSAHFPVYTLLGVDAGRDIQLTNLELAGQLEAQISASAYLALCLSLPLLLWEAWRYASPALYRHERRAAGRAVAACASLFYAGLLLGYWLIFPLTLRLLATYSLSTQIATQLTLQSYLSTFWSLTLLTALVCQLPAAAWLLGRLGLLSRRRMARCRRHAVVAVLAVAALITPGGDPASLLALSFPLYLLWELSVRLLPAKA